MKKLIVAVAAFALAVTSQAAVVDWKLNSTATYKGWTAYVIEGTTAASSFANLAAIEAASAGSAPIAQNGAFYNASGSATDANFTTTAAKYYFVVVNGDTYKIGSAIIDGASKVYDPTAQESSKGTVTTAWANASFGADQKFGGDVPEPTSAMLLLLGVAGLALRRRQA